MSELNRWKICMLKADLYTGPLVIFHVDLCTFSEIRVTSCGSGSLYIVKYSTMWHLLKTVMHHSTYLYIV